MIIKTHQLNFQQLNALQHLIALCKTQDSSAPNVYAHILSQPRALPACLLYYENEQLTGFLSVYFFYDDAVEVTLMVAPTARKRGIAKDLLNTILPLIQQEKYSNLIFSSPSQLNDAWFNAKKLVYLHSEFHMERSDLSPLLCNKKPLTFRQASSADIPLLHEIDSACFPAHQEKTPERFESMLQNREYQVILALENERLIGKAHLRWQDHGATLSDIAVIPAYQGKGYGSALISQCINLALSDGKPLLNLDVETHNLRALNLYTRLGFQVQNACDYWKMTL